MDTTGHASEVAVVLMAKYPKAQQSIYEVCLFIRGFYYNTQ